jgi:hypothetical protein
MVRYQQGEMEAFEELYRRTSPMIRGFPRRRHDQPGG